MKRKVTYMVAVSAQIVAGLLLLLCALLYLPLALVASAIRAGARKVVGRTAETSQEPGISVSTASLTSNHRE